MLVVLDILICLIIIISNVARNSKANTSSYINAIDLSTSGEMLAFGDAASFVHLWEDRKEAKINAYSNPIELPAIPITTPHTPVGENE